MADFNGILAHDPRTEPFVVTIPISEVYVAQEDIDQYAPSYEETEGCPPAP